MRERAAIAMFILLTLGACSAFAQEQKPKQLGKKTCAAMVKLAKIARADAFILISKDSGEPQLLACGGRLSRQNFKKQEKIAGRDIRLFSAKWVRLEINSHCYWYEGNNNTLYKYCPQH